MRPHADEYVERRAQALRSAIRKHSGAKLAELPVALIENSSRAPTNDSGEKLLGNKRAWLPDLMTEVGNSFPGLSQALPCPSEKGLCEQATSVGLVCCVL